MQQPNIQRGRIEAIDVARGVAIVAMAIYHFAWDLEFFGYLEAGTTQFGGWRLFARCIASSFLFLAGVSLFLAHGDRVLWRSFGRRFGQIAAAAALITIGTWFAMPESFIFFGILHEIAAASLIGLLFLRAPPPLTLAVAALVIAAPWFLRSEFFDLPALWWVGLSATLPRSNDYVPILPWVGPALIGVAAAKWAVRGNLDAKLAARHPPAWTAPLQFAGRHSLPIYLLHQPILIGCVWLFAQIAPPAQETPEVRFSQACEAGCERLRDEAFCARYCVCVFDRFTVAGLMDQAMVADPGEEVRAKVQEFAGQCTAETDAGMGGSQ